MKRSIIIELNGDVPPKGEGVTVEAYGRGGVSERDMHAAVFCLIREIADATGESKMEAIAGYHGSYDGFLRGEDG